MLRLFLTINLFFLLFSVIQADSETRKERMKGPITVTSETLTADNKAHAALFEKNVIAQTPEITIHADTMVVFYESDGGDVSKIEATGNVKVLKDSRIITAQSATYFADQEKVTFRGDPRAMDGESIVSGTMMHYFIVDDRFLVENSRVILKGRKEK